MGLLRADPPTARVYLETEVAAPGEEVAAIVSLGGARGRAELLYLNEWDATGEARETAGGALVPIDDAPLPGAGVRCSEVLVAEAELDGEGSHEVVFDLPEDAPGSGADFVEWRVRASTGRGRHLSVAETTLAVESGEPFDGEPDAGTRVAGDGHCEIEIEVAEPAVRAGERLKGVVVLTARRDCAEVHVSMGIERRRVSHPLDGTPSAPWLRRLDSTDAVRGAKLTEGERLELPFELRLAPGLAPTGVGQDPLHACWRAAR